MPLLKDGPKRWKLMKIILKSDKLIVNVVVFKLCNCIWVFLKSKGEKNRRHYLLTDPRTSTMTTALTTITSTTSTPYPSHSSRFNYFDYIKWTVQTMKFFSSLCSHHSWVQMFAAGFCFQIPLAYVSYLMWEFMFHSHIAQLAFKITYLIFPSDPPSLITLLPRYTKLSMSWIELKLILNSLLLLYLHFDFVLSVLMLRRTFRGIEFGNYSYIFPCTDVHLLLTNWYLLSMEPWAAAKIAIS